MDTFLFTPQMKLADLIHTDYKLLLLLPRFGLNLGFGEKSVQECCKQNGISDTLFTMICNVYAFSYYLPGEKELNQVDIKQLILYLQRSHSYYLNNRIQIIQHQLTTISEKGAVKQRHILDRFFEEYKKEVVKHFEYEENTVFPYVLNIEQDAAKAGYSIESFEENHTNIEEKLNDLKNIIIKYLPGTELLSEKTDILFNIFSLEEDLNKHALIEDKILIPLVQKQERHHDK
ncbi:hemerythrin domain-containing protein [Odoribacter lunatus]|uniref:hemerythrin domain-containing protein n=1 Tax=Odoribacter lunatus TaxID=2941335 RepID=UPI00203F6091|nr:hemerythrin domain-containing protein [Odoribacter lunatus]